MTFGSLIYSSYYGQQRGSGEDIPDDNVCFYQNFIGQTTDITVEQSDKFIESLTPPTNVFGTLHSIILFVMIIFITMSVLRNSKFCFYKWVLLVYLAVMNFCLILYYFMFDPELMDEDCGHTLLMILGAILFFYYSICLMIVWTTQRFFKKVRKFVQEGLLPSEEEQNKASGGMFTIWVLSLIGWLTFTGFNVHFTNKGDFKTTFYYNFVSYVLYNVWILFATVISGILYVRIIRLHKEMQSPLNNATLER